MFKALTNEEFLQKLIDNGVKDKPLEDYKGAHVKLLWECHKNEKHIYMATPSDQYKNKYGCHYCTHQKVFVGETDMWTTNPELACMLHNPQDGYENFAGSKKKLDWNCPNCGSLVKEKSPLNVKKQGLSCDNCCDGMSFAEKFVANLLKQLGCCYIYNKPTSWSNRKMYDFYIPSMSLIIETHGIQHYERSFIRCSSKRSARTVDEEKYNDMIKRNIAIENGIQYYIELDCKQSDFDYIKRSILDSKLCELFDLSSVDWNGCHIATITSNVVVCAELWNSGMKNTHDIAYHIGMDKSSVIFYLKKAAQIGLCDYVPNYKKNKKRYKPVLCVETGKVYECISRVKDDGYTSTNVSYCCNGKMETAYGMHWQFI